MPTTDSNRDIAYLVELAKTRLDRGIIHEPRGYYDVIELAISDNTGLITAGNPDVFRNIDQFPVKITHASFAVGYFDQAGNVDNERNVQLISANFRFHDQFYMNPVRVALPVWANKPVMAMDSVSFGTSVWRFDDARWTDEHAGGSFVLSTRDTLEVVIELIGTPTYPPIQGTVTFTGFGVISHRPYVITSTGDLTADGQSLTLATNDYRNDGGEPILITDMTTHVSGDTGDGAIEATGDARRLRVNVRQIGNGTNNWWLQGPINPVAVPNCPSTLLGLTSGRGVVHEFPSPLTWEPGEGISVSAVSSNASGEGDPDSYLTVGLFGYVMIA